MVPGLGLYLDELFFEKYNLKLKYEDEKRERSNAKKLKQIEEIPSNADEDKEDTSISVSIVIQRCHVIMSSLACCSS